MSTLNALKLLREFNMSRHAAGHATAKPRLVMLWTTDPATGRPVGTWVALADTRTETPEYETLEAQAGPLVHAGP